MFVSNNAVVDFSQQVELLSSNCVNGTCNKAGNNFQLSLLPYLTTQHISMTDQQQGIHQSPQLEPTANIPACLPQPEQPAGGITAAPENAEATTSEPPSAKRPRKTLESSEPITEVILRRLTKIKEGDTVLLRLPNDLVKSVVVQGDR